MGMKITFRATGEGRVDNLLRQLVKVAKNCNQESIRTRWRYYHSMRQFLRFCAERYNLQKIQNIAPKHLEAYVAYRRESGISEKTLKGDLAAVRFWHNQIPGVRHQLPDNRALGLQKTGAHEDRAWTDAEYRKLVDLAYRLGRVEIARAMELARETGLRLHEAYRLDRAAAERALRTGVLTVKGKGGLVREVPVTPRAAEVLREAAADVPPGAKLFVAANQKTHRAMQSCKDFIRRHRHQVADSPERAKELAARRVGFHGLRHSFARQEFYSRGGDAAAKKDVAELLGHHRPRVTDAYLARREG
ncbi:MAG: tyrosine-type recombinase/integrase [Firmicutes bacterium]|nr:tyrosine-type recombinase/integrase [Bacillota bacterium]